MKIPIALTLTGQPAFLLPFRKHLRSLIGLSRVGTLFLICISLMFTAGCQDKLQPLKTADQLYDYYCKQCHQQKGAGAYLENLSAEQRTMQTYQVILMIRYNEPGSHPMASFDQINDEQANLLAEYVVKLNR